MARKRKGSSLTNKTILDGQEELLEKFTQYGDLVNTSKIRKQFLKGAKVVQAEAKRLAPKGETGRLRRSIVAHEPFEGQKANQASAFVSIDYRQCTYAHLVEYGHYIETGGNFIGGGFVKGKPFFRPAFDKTKGMIQTLLSKAIESEIKSIESK